MVDEFPQAQVPGEWPAQAGIGHQAMVVKEDADTVGIVLWRHLLGAPCFRAGFCSKTIIPFRGAPNSFFKGCPQGRPSVDSGLALASAATFGLVSVLERIILVRYVPGSAIFTVVVGILQFPPALIALLFVPLQSYSTGVWVAAFSSGVIWGISLVLMFWVLSKHEVSRVVPVVATSPVAVAVLAVSFLSENLTVYHWLAIIVTVAGAGLISSRWTGGAQHAVLGLPLILLLLASLLAGAGQFLTKVAAEEMGLWNLFTVRSIGLGAACILLPLRPSLIQDARAVLADRVGVAMLVMNEGFLVFVASFFTLWAIVLGPVSLAATLMSTRPLFVFVYSILLSSQPWRLLDEPLDRDTLVKKFAFTAMIVAGITAISLL